MEALGNFSDYESFRERASALKQALSHELSDWGYYQIDMVFGIAETNVGEEDAVRYFALNKEGERKEIDTFLECWLDGSIVDNVYVFAVNVNRDIGLKISDKLGIPLEPLFMVDDEYILQSQMTDELFTDAFLIYSYQLPFENPIKNTLLMLSDGLFYYDETLDVYKQITLFDDSI